MNDEHNITLTKAEFDLIEKSINAAQAALSHTDPTCWKFETSKCIKNIKETLQSAQNRSVSDQGEQKVFEVWLRSDDFDDLLVGIGTTEEKANEMRKYSEEEMGDGFKYEIIPSVVDQIIINDQPKNF